WIVMKCLNKDRNRRYESANGLARDLERYLCDEPVQACPPSAGYRLRQFVRRNRGPVLAAVGLVSMLLVTLAVLLVSYLQASRSKDELTRVNSELKEANDALGESNEHNTNLAYNRSIALVHHEWQDNRLGRALDVLRVCPED